MVLGLRSSLKPRTMNRYGRGPTNGPSKATASTLCQKCLKRDMCAPSFSHFQKADYGLRHYSYECKAVAQERPYVSRPSRTQQLLNPKLVPKLNSDVPQDLLRKCVFYYSRIHCVVFSGFDLPYVLPLNIRFQFYHIPSKSSC